MTKINKKHTLDLNPLKSHLCNSFVLLVMIEQNDMILDITFGVHRATIISTKITPLKTIIVLHLELHLLMTKILLLHTILAHDMTTIKDILDLTALRIHLHIDPHIKMTLVIAIDLVLILEIITFPDILLHSDHLQYQEILDTPDLYHTPIHETNLFQFNHKLPMIPLTMKYKTMKKTKYKFFLIIFDSLIHKNKNCPPLIVNFLVFYMPYRSMNFSSLDHRIQSTSSQIIFFTDHYYTVLPIKVLSCSNALNKIKLNLNTNNFLHELTSQSYKIIQLSLYITFLNTKKIYLIENTTPILCLRQGNDIIVKPLDSFSSSSIISFETKYKNPIKSITNLFINNLFYSMTLIISVMMKTTFTRGYQKIQHLSELPKLF